MAHKNRSNISPMGSHKGAHLGKGRHKRPQDILSREEANDRLYDIFSNHGFEDISHEVRLKLVDFYILLMSEQKDNNFTRLLTMRDIGIKHFIDCLIIPRLVNLTFPLIDVGTGPGFPGIPLRMIVPTEKKIILAEGVQKRVEFLKKVRDEIKLENLDILGKNITKEFEYPVGGVITRAVEDCRNTLGNVINSLQLNGKVFLMKGPKVGPEIQAALDEYGEFYVLEKDIPYELPKTNNERRLVVFRKIKSPVLSKLRDDDDDWDEDDSNEIPESPTIKENLDVDTSYDDDSMDDE
ncbi:MAG: class I SAM-dependent methyltransferase [Bdellovibrionaceae bacterium]|nr:class I SAM-dependent methyltransferase [Pseudobdellovibrionaceae bacterium]